MSKLAARIVAASPTPKVAPIDAWFASLDDEDKVAARGMGSWSARMIVEFLAAETPPVRVGRDSVTRWKKALG